MQPQSLGALIPASSYLCIAFPRQSYSKTAPLSEFPAITLSRNLPGSVLILWCSFSVLLSLSLLTNCCLHKVMAPDIQDQIRFFYCGLSKGDTYSFISLSSDHLYNSQNYQSSKVEWEFPVDRSYSYFPHHYIPYVVSHTPFINIYWISEKVQMAE